MTINLDTPNLVLEASDQPDIRPLNGLPVLYQTWEVATFILRGEETVIDEGFEYDGMTIPNAVRTISGLEQDGPHRAADLFHDRAYQCQGKLPGWSFVLTRQECDDIHRMLCLAAGMTQGKCDTIHFFLGLFGGIAWNKSSAMGAEYIDLATAPIETLVQYRLTHATA